MEHDWPPAARYQAIAMLTATVRLLSIKTGVSEDEILADLESDNS